MIEPTRISFDESLVIVLLLMNPRMLASAAAALLSACAAPNIDEAARRPNIVVVITDDQGYGDLGRHGNSVIRTPRIDALGEESVRLTNYHVDPTCAPTRAALLTGRYSSRTGVWHTIMGRSIIRADEKLLPEILADAGYQTGMFGKWHLGDNYPARPEDRGFQRVTRHGGGGVGQTPDFWGNDYFDDVYWSAGAPIARNGYCTDVFFDDALAFIEENHDRPFFAYVSTNAPHSPFLVEERYSRSYAEQGVPDPMDKFYGMIENIDDNVGRLIDKLDELGLRENTILIFTTDNGTAAGVAPDGAPFTDSRWGGFNAGMKGRKGSEDDGGHRVPFFLRWPAGGLGEPRDVDALTAHIDVLPTLLGLIGAEVPAGLDLDGHNLGPLLRGAAPPPERTLFVHSQRVDIPEKYRKSAVMTARWRLVNGAELYDIDADPGQRSDAAAEHPAVVDELRAAYDGWWARISERFGERVPIRIGAAGENPARLTAHDWLPDSGRDQDVPWNQELIRRDPAVNGRWRVEVAQAGRYEFSLLQWDRQASRAIDAVMAGVKVGDREATTRVEAGAGEVRLELDLPAGETWLRTSFTAASGAERGAFFVYVQRR